MKICFVIPTLTGGGAERVAVTVLSALSSHDRTLYLFSDRNAVYRDQLDSAIRVVVAARQGWVPRLLELAGFLRSTRPDIVMPFLSYFITAIAAWMAGTGARVVFNQGTPTTGFLDDSDFSWTRPLRRRVFSAMTRWCYRRAAAVVVTSQGVEDDLADRYGVPREHIRVLHNPVDLQTIGVAAQEPVETAPGDGPVLVAVGRLASVKGYPLLIEVLARLAGPHLWIVGEGPDRERLEQLVVEKGVGGRVRFWGFQPNPWRFIARADVLVLTSAYEGFGNVLIEAMACATPVVATRSPGTQEIITHGVNGLLVEHEPRALVDAITQLLKDSALRDRLVSRAAVDVQWYALPNVVDRYERLFRELAA